MENQDSNSSSSDSQEHASVSREKFSAIVHLTYLLHIVAGTVVVVGIRNEGASHVSELENFLHRFLIMIEIFGVCSIFASAMEPPPNTGGKIQTVFTMLFNGISSYFYIKVNPKELEYANGVLILWIACALLLLVVSLEESTKQFFQIIGETEKRLKYFWNFMKYLWNLIRAHFELYNEQLRQWFVQRFGNLFQEHVNDAQVAINIESALFNVWVAIGGLLFNWIFNRFPVHLLADNEAADGIDADPPPPPPPPDANNNEIAAAQVNFWVNPWAIRVPLFHWFPRPGFNLWADNIEALMFNWFPGLNLWANNEANVDADGTIMVYPPHDV